MKPASQWRCEFSLRSWVFGFGFQNERDYGCEIFLGLGPLVLGWSW